MKHCISKNKIIAMLALVFMISAIWLFGNNFAYSVPTYPTYSVKYKSYENGFLIDTTTSVTAPDSPLINPNVFKTGGARYLFGALQADNNAAFAVNNYDLHHAYMLSGFELPEGSTVYNATYDDFSKAILNTIKITLPDRTINGYDLVGNTAVRISDINFEFTYEYSTRRAEIAFHMPINKQFYIDGFGAAYSFNSFTPTLGSGWTLANDNSTETDIDKLYRFTVADENYYSYRALYNSVNETLFDINLNPYTFNITVDAAPAAFSADGSVMMPDTFIYGRDYIYNIATNLPSGGLTWKLEDVDGNGKRIWFRYEISDYGGLGNEIKIDITTKRINIYYRSGDFVEAQALESETPTEPPLKEYNCFIKQDESKKNGDALFSDEIRYETAYKNSKVYPIKNITNSYYSYYQYAYKYDAQAMYGLDCSLYVDVMFTYMITFTYFIPHDANTAKVVQKEFVLDLPQFDDWSKKDFTKDLGVDTLDVLLSKFNGWDIERVGAANSHMVNMIATYVNGIDLTFRNPDGVARIVKAELMATSQFSKHITDDGLARYYYQVHTEGKDWKLQYISPSLSTLCSWTTGTSVIGTYNSVIYVNDISTKTQPVASCTKSTSTADKEPLGEEYKPKSGFAAFFAGIGDFFKGLFSGASGVVNAFGWLAEHWYVIIIGIVVIGAVFILLKKLL